MGLHLSSKCRKRPSAKPDDKQGAFHRPSLTAQQIELLGLLEAGLSNQQISDRLDVTLTTIKGHLQRLYGKLGVSSRSAALARARVLKLV